MRRLPFAALCLILALPGTLPADESPHLVTRQELARAMQRHGPYDITKTTNAGRLQAETLLNLVRDLRTEIPHQAPLFVSHKDWFAVYIEAAGVAADKAPIFARLGYDYGQDLQVEYRPKRVIRRIRGPSPTEALQVKIWWEGSGAKTAHYSYEDTLSVPHLQVTDHQVITYRMLDFGDMVVMDDIQGLTGRPTTGLLGVLFRLIGEGSIVETRIAVSTDGLQIVRGRVWKGFMGITTTVTIFPEGRGMKDLPEGREDLRAIEDRLKRPIDVEYVPAD